MSLFRQLVCVFSIVLFMVFASNFFNNLQSHREYLRLQLNSHANDAATALGLALKPYLAQQDKAAMMSLVDIIFDGGYYQQIVLTDMDGKPLIKRESPLQIKDTPAWFVRWMPLDSQPAQIEITANWTYSAMLSVTSHPGFVYATLWQNSLRECLWGLFGWLVATLVLSILLRLMLRPLKAVEQQAYQICQQQFVQLDNVPKTREFAGIVMAMNQLSRTVENMLGRATQYANHMREQAFCDAESGLYNQTRFMRVLQQMLSTGVSGPGALMMLQLSGYAQWRTQHSTQQQAELMQWLAELLEQHGAKYHGNVNARWSDDCFILLLPGLQLLEANLLSQRLVQDVKGAELQGLSVLIGGVFYRHNMTAEPLLAVMKHALQQAQHKGINQWVWLHGDEDQGGRQEWQKQLKEVLQQQSLQLMAQPVVQLSTEQPLYQEVLARVSTPDGDTVSANLLFSSAKRAGRMTECDQLVLRQVIDFLAQPQHQQHCLAVNLSLDSLLDQDFLAWLLGALAKRQSVAQRLVIEISMRDVHAHVEQAELLLAKAHWLGCRLALEHVGSGVEHLDYISRLKPDFIKIDGSYIRGIASDRDSQFFVHSLTGIAHSLQIQVIAECTENAQDYAVLHTLQLDAVQGFHVGKPEPLC